MKAALLSGPRQIAVVDVPDAVAGPGKVLVRVEAAAICGSDLSGYRGLNPRVTPPTIMGHEIAGRIVDVGLGVAADLVGRRVCVEPNVSCRTCPQCLAGLPNICPSYKVLGQDMSVQGGLADLVAVAADQVLEIPDTLTAAEAAIVQPLAISYHGIDRVGVCEGEHVLVLGSGPIGLGALLLARDLGAHVIVADIVDERLAVALRLGAEAALRFDAPDFRDRVLEATGGKGADVVIEAVGGAQQETIAQAIALAAIRGRICVMGSFAKPPVPFPAYDFKNRELTITGSHGHPAAMVPTLALVAAGRLAPRQLITHTMPLRDVERAFQVLDTRSEGVIKVVLEP